MEPLFKNTQNKAHTTTTGETIWKSRNVAVCVCVIRPNPSDTSKLQVLAGLRGEDVTDTDKWCMPCGYLDWDESIPEAAKREVFEETNLLINEFELEFYQLDSNPEKARQNVTAHFTYFASTEETENQNLTPRDPKEVKQIKWIDIDDCENYDWAFDHGKRIAGLILNA
jgi:8-oxo-dGTP pyrophosphatase MutT (NUDIX family)